VRTDIQALRGFAVLIVLLFHAKLGLPSGYLGVDVFFVISGFLITKMIKESMERGDFSFAAFYFKRAKRLLPAAYATFLVTGIAAPFFLTAGPLHDFRNQLLGAVGFVANRVLYKQADYFGTAAELKPLLHIWSLSLEEQYYFILPAMLLIIRRRYWKMVALIATAVSLVMCMQYMAKKPTWAFYSLQTRAWELGLGTIGALLTIGPRMSRVVRALFWPALAILIAAPLIADLGPHPGLAAMFVCFATLAVILRSHGTFFENTPVRTIARVGNASYSLYLVHWPIFAFLNNAWVAGGPETVPATFRLGALALSFAIGLALYRFIETPCRHAHWRPSVGTAIKAVAASVGVVMASLAMAAAAGTDQSHSDRFRPNYGLDKVCEQSEDFHPLPECRSSDTPDVLVWGDSFAAAIAPAVANSAQIVQATRSSCGPFLGAAVVRPDHPSDWSAGCISFNDSVLAFLRDHPELKTVVLSTPLHYMLRPGSKAYERDADGRLEMVDTGDTLALRSLRRTVNAVRAAGRRVVLVAPPPAAQFNVGLCLERMGADLPVLGVRDCTISTQDWHRSRAEVNTFLASVPQQIGLPVVDLAKFMCDSIVCNTSLDGVPLYRDATHLSVDGALHLAQTLSPFQTAIAEAR
jgi:peptidoglycan/LPS O-acetylase OafA/YrhL